MTRSRRIARWTTTVVIVAVLAGSSLSCAPPTTATWVKVQWARDVGGTTNTSTGAYTAAWNRYVTKAGVTTGPTPIPSDPLFETPPPSLLSVFGASELPNGTARFPWNGYAGEGISVTPVGSPYPDYQANFPAGSCTVFGGGLGTTLRSAIPSPNGTLIALIWSNNDIGGGGVLTSVEIHSLTAGACPVVARASYERYPGPLPVGHSISGAAVTWAPNSGAILYALDQQPNLSASMVRLDATSGATPRFVLSATEGCTVPLGWSIENRVLLQCIHPTASGLASQLESIALGGGVTHVVDTFTPGPGTVSSTVAYHYGYYVPGTSTIVFNKAVPVVNADGARQAWFQVHTMYDVPLAQSTPLEGSPPPFGWHQVMVPQEGIPSPPFEFTDVPNPELIERFVR